MHGDKFWLVRRADKLSADYLDARESHFRVYRRQAAGVVLFDAFATASVLASVVPLTEDRVVEITVTDNDVPLLRTGDKVRLQFAGWPALQFSGWQDIIPSYGTFGGKVRFIDPLDDGSGKYRVVIAPDQHTLANGRVDPPWPDSAILRPGTEATGWIMLGKVSLGFELWRQFNAFPPNFRSGSGSKMSKDGKDEKDGKGSESTKLKTK
jgi:multidrug efflux pump subunit AcrA (membrane-fusion protein)